MMFWIIASALSALAVGPLLLPLLRGPRGNRPRAAQGLDVYRDQLAEIERELERGELGAEQAGAARGEIERRLLAAAEAAESAPGQGTGPAAPGRAATWGFALALSIALPAAAIALYLALGSPGVPSLPFAERSPPAAPPEPAFAREMEDLAAKLARRLAEDPDNRAGWLLLGRTYGQLRRFDKAVQAYRTALSRGFDGAEIRGALGEALVARAGGVVDTEARREFAAVLEKDPSNPRARYYAGLALAQDERLQEAIDVWTDLLRAAAPDAPWREVVAQQIRRAAARLGIEPPELPAAPSQAPRATAPAPGAAEVEAAGEMSPEERAAFIRSMVERLARRMEAQPEDFEGWLRLARAYSVLGEAAKAKAALERASDLVRDLPAEAPERAALDEARRALGATP